MVSPIDSRTKTIVGVIPARIGSEEVYAKVLVDLGGKPVIRHVYERAVASGVFDEVLIAADDPQIVNAAKQFGAVTYTTQQNHICGTDRCAEAVQALYPNAEIVVNIQADEPFLHPEMIPLVVNPLIDSSDWDGTTLCCSCHDESTRQSEFTAKIAKSSKTGRAIYFSRAVIPFPRYRNNTTYFQHIGIYGFPAHELFRFAKLGPSDLELAEGLEQLRALEAGMRIKVIETDLAYAKISIDTQDDIDRARQLLCELQHRNGTDP